MQTFSEKLKKKKKKKITSDDFDFGPVEVNKFMKPEIVSRVDFFFYIQKQGLCANGISVVAADGFGSVIFRIG